MEPDSTNPARTVVRLAGAGRANHRLVELSDGSQFVLAVEAVERVGLAEGELVDELALRRLRDADLRASAHEAALRLLSTRARSEREMQIRLGMRGYEPAIVDEEIERLRRTGLLDDQKFAQAWVAERQRTAPRGRRMLRYELLGRGIDPDAVNEVTAEVDDREVALGLARAKARAPRQEEYDAFVTRVGGFLRRRGFGFDVTADALRTAWAERQDPGPAGTESA